MNSGFFLRGISSTYHTRIDQSLQSGLQFCPRHLVEMNLGDMAWPLFKKIIDEAAEHLPVTLVLFFRGESLLHPEIDKMIAYAKVWGLTIQLASNGFILTPELAERLVEAGLDFISFSLDTIDKETYAQTRRNSDLRIAMENVLHFVEICEQRKRSGKKSPEIQVSSVEVDDYRKGQPEFIAFWRQYVDRVRIYIEHSSDGNLGSIASELLPDKEARRACGKVFSDIVIYWDGEVALCNHDWAQVCHIGNVQEKSIEEIWRSAEYQKIRKMHQDNSFDIRLACNKCDHWQMYYLPEGFVGRVYEKLAKDSQEK